MAFDSVRVWPDTLALTFDRVSAGDNGRLNRPDKRLMAADRLRGRPSRRPRNLSAAISRLSGRFNRPLSPADTLSNVSAKVSGHTRTLSKAIYMLSAAYKSPSNSVNCAKNDSYALSS